MFLAGSVPLGYSLHGRVYGEFSISTHRTASPDPETYNKGFEQISMLIFQAAVKNSHATTLLQNALHMHTCTG